MKKQRPSEFSPRRLMTVIGVLSFVAFALRCGGELESLRTPGESTEPSPDDEQSSPDSTAETAPNLDKPDQPGRSGGSDGPKDWIHFDWQAPSGTQKSTRVQLWATNYYVPELALTNSPEAFIRGIDEKSLFGTQGLTKAHWCDLALQGSARIRKADGQTQTVSFAGRSGKNRIDCSATILSGEIVSKIAGNRFERVPAVYGRGARVKDVIPYRTIAVDPGFIPHGSAVYIPAARGQRFSLYGQSLTHDGYFFAGDSGSAIIGSHIDVFTGSESYRGKGKQKPLGFVTSSDRDRYEAYIINNDEIRDALRRMHGYLQN